MSRGNARSTAFRFGWLLLLSSACVGCTLWKVVHSPFEPVGQHRWERIGEHAEKTGRIRYVVEEAEVSSRFAAVSVAGRVRFEAEMNPWYAYHTRRRFEREVESIFTPGVRDTSAHVTIPPAKGGYPADESGLEPPFVLPHELSPVWLEIPAEEYPHATVEWTLVEAKGGRFVAYGAVETGSAGSFEIELPADTLHPSAGDEIESKRLILEAPGQDPYALEISAEVIAEAMKGLSG